MATVKLAPYTIERIAAEAGRVVRENYGLIPVYQDAPPGVADQAYALILPPAMEQRAKDSMADWMWPKVYEMYLAVADPEADERSVKNTRAQVRMDFATPHMRIDGRSMLFAIPGVDLAYWQDNVLVIKPTGDGSGIEQPELRAYVQSIMAVKKAKVDLQAAVEKARDDMAKFLGQYKTLQKAVADNNPWIMMYVPSDMRELYNRKDERRPRQPKVKGPTPAVDITQLITQAGKKTLQLAN